MLIIIDSLPGHTDEGFKNIAFNIANRFNRENELLKLSIKPDGGLFSSLRDKLYINQNSNLLRNKRIDHHKKVVYFPHSSTTVASLIRGWRISNILRCPISIVSLQHKPLNIIQRKFVGFVKPHHIFFQEKQTEELFHSIGVITDFLPSGVDLQKFKPVDEVAKSKLRLKYGLEQKSLIATHVGHLNEDRGIEKLIKLKKFGITPILVASTSTKQDKKLANYLKSEGISVINQFIHKIQEIYQLSDIYIFPTQKSGSAIGCPLSVLEAMACNIKVLSTRFQGLTEMFKDGDGFLFYDSEDEFEQSIKNLIEMEDVRTREKVLDYSWEKIADHIVESLNKIES